MIDIKEILEEVEFKEINELLEKFQNESELIEFENILNAYKYKVLSDQKKVKEIKNKLLRYVDGLKILEDKMEDKKFKFSLLKNGEFDNLKKYYKENKKIDMSLSYDKIDETIKKFDAKDKEQIYLDLINIRKNESEKTPFTFTLEYSILPNFIKSSLVNLVDLSIDSIVEEEIFYRLKFKKDLNFEDFEEVLEDINIYQKDLILSKVIDLYSINKLNKYEKIKKHGLKNLEDIFFFPSFAKEDEEKLYKEMLKKEIELGRDFVTYLDELYKIGFLYYEKNHSTRNIKNLEDVYENILKSKNEVNKLKMNILDKLKDEKFINISSNIKVLRDDIINIFKRNDKDDILLIDKFISENTKDEEILEEEKIELMKTKIYLDEIDKVYNSKNKETKIVR